MINKWKEWRKARREKYLNKMKENNKCPDCRGRGYYMSCMNEYSFLDYASPFSCPSCCGTGKFPNKWM